MIDVKWFTGATGNYAQQVFRHVDAADSAGFPPSSATTRKLRQTSRQRDDLAAAETASRLARPAPASTGRAARGPGGGLFAEHSRGDGGVFGHREHWWRVEHLRARHGHERRFDRFKQIEPKVLIACDGVTYGGRDFDRLAVVAELCAALPSVQHVIVQDNWERCNLIIQASKNAIDTIATQAYLRGLHAKMMPKQRLLSHFGCRLTTRCGSSIPAAPRACPSPSCTATAAASSSRWPARLHNDVGCSYAPNTWASASTGTAPPAG